MTMALPFAHDGGSYLFIFLSICATLCSLYLHHVQGAKATTRCYDQCALATATWIDLSIDCLTASHSNVVVKMVQANRSMPLSRCLWDPGIELPAVPMLSFALPSSSNSCSIWDPGIRHYNGIGLFKPFAPTILYSRRAASLKMSLSLLPSESK